MKIEREKTKKQEYEMNDKILDLGESIEYDEKVEHQTLDVRRSS